MVVTEYASWDALAAEISTMVDAAILISGSFRRAGLFQTLGVLALVFLGAGPLLGAAGVYALAWPIDSLFPQSFPKDGCDSPISEPVLDALLTWAASSIPALAGLIAFVNRRGTRIVTFAPALAVCVLISTICAAGILALGAITAVHTPYPTLFESTAPSAASNLACWWMTRHFKLLT
jgi:hypothetical protein